MNTKNNKRRQATRERIEKLFISLLQTREISQISVSDICKQTGVNRSTFYANYADVYDLANTLRAKLEQEVAQLYSSESSGKYHSDNWLRLFYHIRDNPLFYKTYFKLGYDNTHSVELGQLYNMYPVFPQEHMGYHVEFFKAGFNAIVKLWLENGCRETPEEMSEILISEYKNRPQSL